MQYNYDPDHHRHHSDNDESHTPYREKEERPITSIQEAIKAGRFQALLDGRGLEPRYYAGDLVTVDTSVPPEPGDGAFCRLETGEYVFLLLDKDGHAYNHSQNLFFLRGTFTVIGAVVEVFPV